MVLIKNIMEIRFIFDMICVYESPQFWTRHEITKMAVICFNQIAYMTSMKCMLLRSHCSLLIVKIQKSKLKQKIMKKLCSFIENYKKLYREC